MSHYQRIPLALQGCFKLVGKRPNDNRGWFYKPYFQEGLAEIGINFRPTEVYFSESLPGVIRGMHFQTPPHQHQKLVFCLRGRVLDVGLDLREGSPSYGKYFTEELSADGSAIFFAPGIAHGFACLEQGTLLGYLVDQSYAPESDQGVLYNSFGMNWPVEAPIVSNRDSNFVTLENFKSPFKFS